MYSINPGKSFYKVSEDSFFINDYETGKWMFNAGIPELDYINWTIENFKNQGKNFVDIGAHIGTWSWSLAPHFNQTYSFECNPEVYNCLCANIFLKNLSMKVTTHQFGISSENIESEYYMRSKDGGGNGFTYLGESREKDNIGSIIMRLRRLDDLKIKNIGLIKIDTEGHEKEVLMGSLETLKESNFPPIIFESWSERREDEVHHVPARKLRRELFQYIDEIGYSIFPLRGNDELFLATRSK